MKLKQAIDEARDAARKRSGVGDAVREAVECCVQGGESAGVEAVDGVGAATPDEAESVAAEVGAVRFRDDVDERGSNRRIGRVAAAGKSIAWDATAVFRLQDGRIVEEWVSRDELGMLQQLGAMPASGQPVYETAPRAHVDSLRLAHPEQAADFARQITEASAEER